jgi:hypothetical protein
MKIRLSSRMTFFYKFIFPILFILVASLFIYNNWSNFNLNLRVLYIALFSILGILIFLFCCRLKAIYVIEENIHISNFFKNIVIDKNEIAFISHFLFNSPPLIWVHFKNETTFGNSIIFTPYFKFFAFFSHPVLKFLEPVTKTKAVKKNNIFDFMIVIFILFWILLWTFLLLNGLLNI